MTAADVATWLVLLFVASAAAAYILLPRRATSDMREDAGEALRAERAGLLALLRELDDDATSGRISPEDRLQGRRELGPRLRAVTEALAALGEPRDAPETRAAGAEATTAQDALDAEAETELEDAATEAAARERRS